MERPFHPTSAHIHPNTSTHTQTHTNTLSLSPNENDSSDYMPKNRWMELLLRSSLVSFVYSIFHLCVLHLFFNSPPTRFLICTMSRDFFSSKNIDIFNDCSDFWSYRFLFVIVFSPSLFCFFSRFSLLFLSQNKTVARLIIRWHTYPATSAKDNLWSLDKCYQIKWCSCLSTTVCTSDIHFRNFFTLIYSAWHTVLNIAWPKSLKFG